MFEEISLEDSNQQTLSEVNQILHEDLKKQDVPSVELNMCGSQELNKSKKSCDSFVEKIEGSISTSNSGISSILSFNAKKGL